MAAPTSDVDRDLRLAPRQRVNGEHPVDRDQPHPFDLALGKEQPVEGVTRLGFRIEFRKDVALVDDKKASADRAAVGWNGFKRSGQVEFPDPRLDRHFPKTRDADKGRFASRPDETRDA